MFSHADLPLTVCTMSERFRSNPFVVEQGVFILHWKFSLDNKQIVFAVMQKAQVRQP
jgi:hypothetical protein